MYSHPDEDNRRPKDYCQVRLDRWEPWQLCGRNVRFQISQGFAPPEPRIGFFFVSGPKESARVMIFTQEGPITQCIRLRQEDVDHIERASENSGADFTCFP